MMSESSPPYMFAEVLAASVHPDLIQKQDRKKAKIISTQYVKHTYLFLE